MVFLMSIKEKSSKINKDKNFNKFWVKFFGIFTGITLSYILVQKVYSVDNVIIEAITAGILSGFFILIFGFIDKYISKISDGK